MPSVRRLQDLRPEGVGVRHIYAASVQNQTVRYRPCSTGGVVFNFPALGLELWQLLRLATKLLKEGEFQPRDCVDTCLGRILVAT
jgi:hypothetical protein